MHWIHWDKICFDKDKGGLGVRHVKEFNLALLGKWCWRSRSDEDGLWLKVLARKYETMKGVIRDGGGN